MSDTMDHLSPEVLSAHLDGELRGAEAEAARSHLESCAHCRTELASMGQIAGLFGRLEGMPASDALKARLQEQAVARKKKPVATVTPIRKRRWSPLRLSMAASVVLLVSLVFTAVREGLWDSEKLTTIRTPTPEQVVRGQAKDGPSGPADDKEQAQAGYRQAAAEPTPSVSGEKKARTRTGGDDAKIEDGASSAGALLDLRGELKPTAPVGGKTDANFGTERSSIEPPESEEKGEVFAEKEALGDRKKSKQENGRVPESKLDRLARQDRAVESPRELAKRLPAMKAPTPTIQAAPEEAAPSLEEQDTLDTDSEVRSLDAFSDQVANRDEALEAARRLEEAPIPPIQWELTVYQISYRDETGTPLGVLSFGVRVPRPEARSGEIVVHCDPGKQLGYGDRARPVQAALLPTDYQWPEVNSMPEEWRIGAARNNEEGTVVDPTSKPPTVALHLEGRVLVLDNGRVLAVRLPLWLKEALEAVGFRPGSCADGRPSSTVVEFEADWSPAK